MHYDNKIKRFLLRKDFFKRAKGRLKKYKRRLNKDEFDDMAHLFRLLQRDPKVIFDCGANIGFVTHQFKSKFPEARVYAFEPNPSVFEKLNLQYSADPIITCLNSGVADVKGELTFYINRNSGTSSFLPPTEYHKDNLASSKIVPKSVPVINLQEVMVQYEIKQIDILKLDIEGFEIKAMEGIDDITNSVSIIFTEVNLIPTYENQPLIEDIIVYLRNKGFHLFNFYGINENQNRQASITNLLFISPSFKAELIKKGYKRSFSY